MDIEKAQAIIEEADNIKASDSSNIGTTGSSTEQPTDSIQPDNKQPQNSLSNLIPFGSDKDTRSVEEVREYNRKGGKKSGETRRKRKTARELLEKMLVSNLSDDQVAEILGSASSMLEGDQTVYNVMLAKMVQQSMAGDTKAFIAIRDTAGEKPVEQSVTLTDTMTEADRKQIDKMRKQLMDISKIG